MRQGNYPNRAPGKGVNKHVLILSKIRKDITVADDAKKTLEKVSSNDATEYGFDVLDRMAEKSDCITGT